MRAPISPIPQRPEWTAPAYKDVLRDSFQFRESLPLPLVTYPHDYGAWIAFQESEETQPYLCSCHRDACIGFLRLNEEIQSHRLGRENSLVDYFLPREVVRSNTLRAGTLVEFKALPLFRDHLCHLCNRRIPPVRWTNADEQSLFLQHFGWYFHVALYAAGLSPDGDFSTAILDSDLRELVQVDPAATRRQLGEFQALYNLGWSALDGAASQFDEFYPGIADMRCLQLTLNEQTKQMQRFVEERLRRSLSFPPHGKTEGSELILFWIVSALFYPTEVLHHARPSFLDGLELDIFVPSLQLAIEYQGEQHYQPFPHLGGIRHLLQVQQRDTKKAALCKTHGIDLRFFTIVDKLTEDYVADRLSDLLPNAALPCAASNRKIPEVIG
jgi:hypothetical protein